MKGLLSSDAALGHCINANHVEQPCGDLLAVITAIEGDTVRWKYLNKDRRLSTYNVGAGCWAYCREVTPISEFGVEVRTGREDGDAVYWCEPVAKTNATYKDGSARRWQERGGPIRYVARTDVLRVAMAASRRETTGDW